MRQTLWEGQVEEVIQTCQALANHCPEAACSAHSHYFSTPSERMRYNRFRMMGLMIGSGVIESGCKHIITQRLKLPGARPMAAEGRRPNRQSLCRLAQRSTTGPLPKACRLTSCHLTTTSRGTWTPLATFEQSRSIIKNHSAEDVRAERMHLGTRCHF